MKTALRTITRTPAASLFVVLVLTVSISASVAIFTLLDASLLKPLPYPHADRLVTFTYSFNGHVVPRTSEAKFTVWQHVNRAVEEPTAVQFRPAELGTADGLQRVRVGAVSAAFFRLFATSFIAGRPFADREVDDANGLVVLSHRFWQQQFGDDRGVLGRRLTLDGEARTVIGVAAPFDSSLLGDQPDLWIPPGWIRPTRNIRHFFRRTAASELASHCGRPTRRTGGPLRSFDVAILASWPEQMASLFAISRRWR